MTGPTSGRARSPEDALAEALADTRRERRWAQADLAAYLRSRGLPWTRDTVRHVEDRSREVSVSEFFRLVELLHIRFEGSLLLDDSSNSAGGGTDFLVSILQGDGSSREIGLMQLKVAMYADAEADRAIEQSVAERLGVGPEEVREAALRTWGRGLAEERERRVRRRLDGRDLPARGVQGVRGHVTRDLLAELRAASAPREQVVWDVPDGPEPCGQADEPTPAEAGVRDS